MSTRFPAPSTVAAGWARIPEPRPAARLRLICFHAAGAGPSMYRSWASGLPEEVELVAVQLPGRETRLGEERLTDYPTAVAAAFEGLAPLFSRPYALFGHSMGALLGYGVALAAQRAGLREPSRLLLSGCEGPGAWRTVPERLTWSDQRLVEELRRNGGTPEEVLAMPELLELVLPVLRSDYRIVDSFQPPAGGRLECPLSVFGGEEDRMDRDGLAAWSAVSRAECSVRMFPGGHFFLTGEAGPRVLAAIAADLAATPA
ncbi:thioesterase II family protein [Kitasatospora sp. NPDC052896]|uniref:thioesterase II family protein n=1 Tax=Kitasatospora sp. NPDC052896 TaxID=3364061 RepID=UPI0037C70E44